MKKKCSKKRIRYIAILIIIIVIIILIKNINKAKTKEISAETKEYESNQNEEMIIQDDEDTNKTNEVSNKSDSKADSKAITNTIKKDKKKTNSKTNENNSKTNNTDNSNQKITYIKGILLVNKKYTLPSTYNPGVNTEAKEHFDKMKQEAAKDDIKLKIGSGFRSYSTQKIIYNRNLSKHGEKIASRFSAKPGQSEHQTGLAFDINQANRSFVGTKEAKWLKESCYKYGFIIRYPENKESITGYVYEPWHIRYVGDNVAKEIYEKGICLEEYLEV